jgi:hypothetical protein
LFLTELKNNNLRAKFEQNKILYQAYKDDIIQFAKKTSLEPSKIDLLILNANVVPRKCLTKVNNAWMTLLKSN